MRGTSTISPGSTTPTTPVSSPWSWQELLSSIRSDSEHSYKQRNYGPVEFKAAILLTDFPCVFFVLVVLRLPVLLRDAPGHQGHGGRIHKLRGHCHELSGVSHNPQTTHQGQKRSMQCPHPSGSCYYSRIYFALNPMYRLPITQTDISNILTQTFSAQIGVFCLSFLLERMFMSPANNSNQAMEIAGNLWTAFGFKVLPDLYVWQFSAGN